MPRKKWLMVNLSPFVSGIAEYKQCNLMFFTITSMMQHKLT